MSFSEHATLDDASRRQLLEVAWESIRHGLAQGRPTRPDPADYPAPLRVHRAAFVTLHHFNGLRGCIGHLEACQPLVLDVADNAFGAAFRDPRFAPLEPWEFDDLTLHLSILSAPEPMSFSDEQDLLRQLRPGVDGLILTDGGARGTFLPAVWESLPQPRQFLTELKRKAGLPGNHWSGTLRVSRYYTEAFGG
ncbi:AmmeMemoRadiSam system protein A [uncultured Thiodictyon sp.]|uniref:AmmeMemoRadiSam system protein A n=1 Tax=uncultured Thiodictyon sp. TaxID=1846217 RepID=UPI0025DB4B73|nr:AmmeMemoRadiSam system protein A [uncultured Thiodictyon sp.]